METTRVTAPFPVTVGNIYFGDLETGTVQKVEYARTVGVTVKQNKQEVPGSGKITDSFSRITGIDIALSSSRLPREIVRKYRGQKVSTNKGFSAINVNNSFVPFAFGFVVKNSDQTCVFNWLPNVTMSEHNSNFETTPVDGANDPVQDTAISALPDQDSEDILIEYDQSEVAEGKTPLTEEEFFAQIIKSMSEELIDSEEDGVGGA